MWAKEQTAVFTVVNAELEVEKCVFFIIVSYVGISWLPVLHFLEKQQF